MNLNLFDEQVRVDCGCWAGAYKDGSGIEIEYCPTHKAAPELLEACEAASIAIPRWIMKDDSGETNPIEWRKVLDELIDAQNMLTAAIQKAKA